MSDLINVVEYFAKAEMPDCIEGPWYRFQRTLAEINRCVTVQRGSRWLDVGCQIGQFLRLLKYRYDVNASGIDDYAPNTVVDVSRRFLNVEIPEASCVFNGTWQYYQRRIDQVGFDLSERFDFISALEVIEHMIDTDAFIAECREHLNPGGYLIVSTPNINSLRNRIEVLIGHYPSGMEYRTVVHHVRLYNAEVLRSHMATHGFEMVSLSGVNFFPMRWLGHSIAQNLDHSLARLLPTFCGNLVGIFRYCQSAPLTID